MNTYKKYICVLCTSTEVESLFEINGRTIIRCTNCNLVSYWPIPTSDELVEIYEDPKYFELEYFSVNENVDSNHLQYQHEAVALGRDFCTAEHPLLDVGPGKGNLIDNCSRLGIPVEGLEISSTCVTALRESTSQKIHIGTIEEFATKTSAKYGVITAFDVIEHCISPLNWLQAAHSLLIPGGKLVISTISINNFLDDLGRFLYKLGVKGPLERLYPLFHLYYFTPQTLVKFLEKSNFSVDSLSLENYNPMKASNLVSMRLALRAIYLIHNISRKKTNQYIIATSNCK